jgi:hypothetical protein
MHRHPIEFRCDVCRRVVDDETRDRARRAWQPLIICEGCLRDAEASIVASSPNLSLATAA